MIMTTTIEDLAKMITPDVVEGYEKSVNKPAYVNKFCAEKHHTKSEGLSRLVDCMMANSRESLATTGIVLAVDLEN